MKGLGVFGGRQLTQRFGSSVRTDAFCTWYWCRSDSRLLSLEVVGMFYIHICCRPFRSIDRCVRFRGPVKRTAQLQGAGLQVFKFRLRFHLNRGARPADGVISQEAVLVVFRARA